MSHGDVISRLDLPIFFVKGSKLTQNLFSWNKSSTYYEHMVNSKNKQQKTTYFYWCQDNLKVINILLKK